MEDSSSLDQLSKKELMERCHHLQTLLEKQEQAVTSWIEALTALTATDQNVAKPLTKGLKLVLRVSKMDGGYIHLLDQKEHILRLTACLGLSKRAEEDLKIIREGEKVPGQVLQKVEALIATHVTEISDLSGKVTQGKKRMLHAGFPLKSNGRVLGTLTIVSKNHKTLSDRDVTVLEAFSQFMATVVQNLTLFEIVSQGKRQWENAIDFISDLVVICDGDFRIVRTNKAILDRFWLLLEDTIGKECFGLLYDGNLFPISKEKLEGMVRRGVTYYEEVASSRLGGIFSVVISPILTFGRLAGSIHVIREITQERLLEKDREELDRKVSLFAPGTIRIDSEGIIRFWDSGTTEILDYQEEEIKGKPFSVICSTPETETIFEKLMENGGTLDYDTTAIAKGDRPIPVSLTLTAPRKQEKKPEEITIFLRNMTQRQEDQMRLGQSARLTAMMETAANVSRILGEKLETMVAHIDRTENALHGPQEFTTCLERVTAQARSVQNVLYQLRQFSDIHPPAKPAVLESSQLFDGLLEMIERKWSHLFQTKGIVFEINPDQRNLPAARGDLQEFLKVFDHLIRNAVEAMPSDGKLILRTRTDRKCVSFILIDHGVGMNPEEINRAFEPFFTTHPGNLGLGLSVVHGIVRKHHGEVRLQSDPGQGTRVTVRLPTISEKPNTNLSTPQSSHP